MVQTSPFFWGGTFQVEMLLGVCTRLGLNTLMREAWGMGDGHSTTHDLLFGGILGDFGHLFYETSFWVQIYRKNGVNACE